MAKFATLVQELRIAGDYIATARQCAVAFHARFEELGISAEHLQEIQSVDRNLDMLSKQMNQLINEHLSMKFDALARSYDYIVADWHSYLGNLIDIVSFLLQAYPRSRTELIEQLFRALRDIWANPQANQSFVEMVRDAENKRGETYTGHTDRNVK